MLIGLTTKSHRKSRRLLTARVRGNAAVPIESIVESLLLFFTPFSQIWRVSIPSPACKDVIITAVLWMLFQCFPSRWRKSAGCDFRLNYVLISFILHHPRTFLVWHIESWRLEFRQKNNRDMMYFRKRVLLTKFNDTVQLTKSEFGKNLDFNQEPTDHWLSK